MNTIQTILKSKLCYTGASETILRERLLPVVSKILKNRLTTIIAGAGYGKTTLAGHIISHFELKSVWYRLDRYDSDFYRFFNYLKTGIEEHYGEIPIDDKHFLSGNSEYIISLFLQEIEARVDGDLVIVIDDYHLVEDGEEIHRALEFMINNMESRLHLVVISRSELPFRISHLRARRELIEITESDLGFTTSEIEKLYLELFRVSLQKNTYAELKEKTGGWAAALILFYNSMQGKNKNSMEHEIEIFNGSRKVLSSYLEENVYDMLPDQYREFLTKTSLFSKLNVRLCNKLLQTNKASQILSDIEKRHLFIFRLNEDDETYSCHHMFQDYLRAKLRKNYSSEEVSLLHKRAALILEQTGDHEEALEHYLHSEQMEDAFRILGTISWSLWLKGKLKRLKSYMKRIPEYYFQKEPWVNFLQAHWLDLNGKTQQAMQILKKACDAFFRENEFHGAALCLQRLGYQYYMDGDFPKAEKTLMKALDIAGGNPESEAMVYNIIIHALASQGKFNRADRYLKQIKHLSESFQESDWRTAQEGMFYYQMGFRYLISGDFRNVMNYLRKAKQLLIPSDFHPLSSKVYFLYATIHCYMGNFTEGWLDAKAGLKLLNDKGVDDFFPTAWLHNIAARNLIELGRHAEALECIKISLHCFEAMASSWGKSLCYMLYYRVYKESGDESTALNYLSQCEPVLKKYKIPWLEAEYKVIKAGIYLDKNEYHEAYQLLKSAENNLSSFAFLMNRVTFSLVRYYWVTGDKETALEQLSIAVSVCRENHYVFPIQQNVIEFLPILISLYATGKEQIQIKKFINQSGNRTRFALIELLKNSSGTIAEVASDIVNQLPSPSLHVSCFGEFKILRGASPIHPENWTSQKAKLLFKFLLMKRKRGYIPRDVLIELLWPDQDSGKTANRLRVTLSSLRKTLEPELVKGMNSSYLLSDADGYKLNLGEHGSCDVDEFTNEIALAEACKSDPDKSIQHYLTAESMYTGDFLAEDLYIDWIEDERSHCQDLYLDILTNIITHYDMKEDYATCITYVKKYLKMDAFAESMYQSLMQYYSFVGNHALVTDTFEKCKEKITGELCCPLSPETEMTYKQVTKQKA